MEDLICLDTDIIIDHLKGKGPGVEIFERIIKKGNPLTTQITRFELLCGAIDNRENKIIEDCLFGFRVLSFDKDSSLIAAGLYRELKKKGQFIGIRDIMIGGIALANNLKLATKNISEFRRIKGLRIIEFS
ncbi:MAG: type II toxin-antitoxin system VapC family toxin [Nitrospinae bacterium]|nr:type II toxin-antitoxin system VapC family toxin [Nitrospinota bacterium]